LAAAIFSMVRSESRKGRAVATAAEWHRTALANPRAVTLQQRLIALKTGFEVLFHTSSSRTCAHKLKSLFEHATRKHRDLLPWSGLLWSPTDKTYLWRWFWANNVRDIERRSEIEDWFLALAEARNEIIHEGTLSSSSYAAPPERPLSRYAGSLFWKGERILREAIKAVLGPEILLCGTLGMLDLARAVLEYVKTERRNRRTERNSGPAVVPEDSALDAGPPPRPLSVLLKELSCESANVVTIHKVARLLSASEDVAIELAKQNANRWGAKARGTSLLITAAERDVLKQAGAEDELSKVWDPCP
jgi:hypothetical protein